MDVNIRDTIIVAIIVLFMGKYLNQRYAPLRNYNIPEPVTGGIIASLILSLFYSGNAARRFQFCDL